MDKIKQFFSSKGVGYYITLPALVCGIVALCLYCKNGVTAFNPELNTNAIVCLWIAIVLCAVNLVIEFKPLKYVAYLVYLFSFMWFIFSQVTYIANVLVAIDGNSFTPAFISTVVFFMLSFVLTLTAGILTTWQPWNKKAKQKFPTVEVGHEN